MKDGTKLSSGSPGTPRRLVGRRPATQSARVTGLLIIAGGGLAIVIAVRAISDPASPIGWDDWTEDPWSMLLYIGVLTMTAGATVLLVAARASEASNNLLVRLIWSALAGIAGFALLLPVGGVVSCVDYGDGGECSNQSWDTLLGLTFPGEPNIAPAIVLGIAAIVGTWLLVGLTQARLNADS